MEKSHVSLERKMCPVTGKLWDTGNLLFDKHLGKKLEKYTTTGYAFCPDVAEKIANGFVALIAIDESKSNSRKTILKGNRVTQEDAFRTGGLMYMRKELAESMFSINIQDMNFIDDKLFKQLEKKANEFSIAEEEDASKNDKS